MEEDSNSTRRQHVEEQMLIELYVMLAMFYLGDNSVAVGHTGLLKTLNETNVIRNWIFNVISFNEFIFKFK